MFQVLDSLVTSITQQDIISMRTIGTKQIRDQNHGDDQRKVVTTNHHSCSECHLGKITTTQTTNKSTNHITQVLDQVVIEDMEMKKRLYNIKIPMTIPVQEG